MGVTYPPRKSSGFRSILFYCVVSLAVCSTNMMITKPRTLPRSFQHIDTDTDQILPATTIMTLTLTLPWSSLSTPQYHTALTSMPERIHQHIMVILDSSSSMIIPACDAARLPLPHWHPDVDVLLAQRVGLPSTHPLIHETLRASSNNFDGEDEHDNIDDWYKEPKKERKMPGDHPPINNYLSYGTPPYSGNQIMTPFWHSLYDIEEKYRAGVAVPDSHPNQHAALASMMPPNHPNIDTLLRNPGANPLPSWHPPINPWVTSSAQPNFQITTPFWHSFYDIEATYKAGTAVPDSHPNQHAALASVMPSNHPNIDTLLRNPGANPLPSWHPPLNPFVVSSAQPNLQITTPFWHSFYDIEAKYRAGVAVPDSHPNQHAALASVMPSNHPNIDTLLRNPGANPLPAGHPPLNTWVMSTAPPKYNISVPQWHNLNIEALYKQQSAAPSSHPSQHAKFASLMPSNHPDIDTLIKNPSATPLPVDHPDIDSWIIPSGGGGVSGTKLYTVYDWHPNIDSALLRMESAPSHHPSVHDRFAPYLPSTHPNIDELIANPSLWNPLPDWHISVDGFVSRRAKLRPAALLALFLACQFAVAICVRWRGKHKKRRAVVKMAKQHGMQSQRKLITPAAKQSDSPYASDSAAIVVESVELAQVPPPLPPRLPNRVGPPPVPFASRNVHAIDEHDAKQSHGPAVYESRNLHQRRPSAVYQQKAQQMSSQNLPPPLPPRDHMRQTSLLLNVKHRSQLYEYGGFANPPPLPPSGSLEIFVLPQKQTTTLHRLKMILMTCRIPKTDQHLGDAIIVSLYLLLNLVCVVVAREPDGSIDWARAFGSLAVGNTMLLIVPATRNSVLTWFLGLPFDHVIIYHRILGRIALVCVVLHFLLFADKLADHASEPLYFWGILAMCCGLIIAATTLNFVRRKFFNVFFFSHYAFVGYFVFAYLHFYECRIYLLVGAGLYALDRLLRLLWGLCPRKTFVFRNKGDGLAQVRFPKNPLTDMLGMHKVGQYYFVNFPSLSLTEWHPFSVSSGPRENAIELHIRALGDHTREIVAHSKECAAQGKQTWIRMDGPYGMQNFNFRRYPCVLLCGGGVGVTPVMGMLKDIYCVGEYSTAERNNPPPQSIKTVYAVWVMRHLHETESFLSEFQECAEIARLNPGVVPALDLRIYVTRAKPEDNLQPPMYAGRPNFESLFQTVQEQYIAQDQNDVAQKPTNLKTLAMLTFACGPAPMVTELCDRSVALTMQGLRVDFHKEIFEF
jgi:Ferric reductase like transmembrane component/FAD-binding domain/Ferric reductase NAD binding domain